MLPKRSLCHCVFNANPKMRKRVWTAQARADRGSGNPENRKKTTKKRYSNKRLHTPSILMEKCRKGSQKGVVFHAGKLSFFKHFDLGAPGVPKEATKLPKDGQGTPNGRPRVYKCLKRVWKWNPKVVKSLTISQKKALQ